MSQPASEKFCSASQAERIALTSACAVGSFVEVTLFQPSAMTLPCLTMTAPNGPPAPSRMRLADNSTARRMNSWCGSAAMQQRGGAAEHLLLASDQQVGG